MASRGQSITVSYLAFDSAHNRAAVGDSANHTLRWLKDGVLGLPANRGAISEPDPTNAPGIYTITLTQSECDCNSGTLCGASSTAGVNIVPTQITFELLPSAAPGQPNGLLTAGNGIGQVSASGGKVAATIAPGDVSGPLPSNVSQWLGSAVPTPNQAGVPIVDVGYSTGTAVVNYDGVLASATTSTVTFPVVDASGASIPDDVRFEYTVLQIVGGAGTGQVVLLTTKAGARTFGVQAGTMPVALGPDSKYVVLGSWRTSVGSAQVTVSGFAAGAITSAAFATNAIDANALSQGAADKAWASSTRSLTDKAGFALASSEHTAISGDVWGAQRSSYAAAGTFGQGVASVQGNVTGSVQSVATGVAVASLGSAVITAASFAAGAIDANAFSQAAADRTWASSSRALTDKANFALSAAEHSQVSTDVWGAARASFNAAGTFGQGVASVQGNLTGSVAGSVGSVSGQVGSVSAAVTVGGYSAGQDPASYVLATPANKIAAATTGQVGLDFSNVKQATSSTTLSNVIVPSVTTVTAVIGANVTQWGGKNVPATSVDGVPKVDVAYTGGVATSLVNGSLVAPFGAGLATLPSTEPADCSVYRGRVMVIYAGTGSGQARYVASASGRTVTPHRNWDVVPDATSQYGFVSLGEVLVSNYAATPGWYTAPPSVGAIDAQLSNTHGAGAWGGGGSSYTLGQIANAVWADATAGDFAVAGTPGAWIAKLGGVNVDGSGRLLLQPSQPGVAIPTVTAVTNAVSANVTQWAGKGVLATVLDGVPVVDVGYFNGLPVVRVRGSANAGSSSGVTLDAAAPADCTPLIGREITLLSGTGAHQSRYITAASGRVVTVHKPWATAPASGTGYEIGGLAESALTMTQPVPLGNTAHTVGDALNAARAVGFGAIQINKPAKTITYLASDNLTVVRQFTVDDANRPTTRT